MTRFRVHETPLRGLLNVDRQRIEDGRGYLSRLFCADEFAAAGAAINIAQINHTITRQRGTVRGLHYQKPPYAESKLVSCIRGQVFDVAVDLRAGSPTFLRWHGEELSLENGRALLIPPGFAHGFQTLCDDCELIYLHSAPYCKDAEGAANAIDPRIGIVWPLAITTVSERDKSHLFFTDDYPGIAL